MHTHGWDLLRFMPAAEFCTNRWIRKLLQVPLQRLVVLLQQEAQEDPRLSQRFHRSPRLLLPREPSSWSSGSRLCPQDENNQPGNAERQTAGFLAEGLCDPDWPPSVSQSSVTSTKPPKWEGVVSTALGTRWPASVPWPGSASPHFGSYKVAGLWAEGDPEGMRWDPSSWSVWTATPRDQLRPEDADDTAGARGQLEGSGQQAPDGHAAQEEDGPTARSRGAPH